MKFNSFDEDLNNALEVYYLGRVTCIKELCPNLSSEKINHIIEAQTKLFDKWVGVFNYEYVPKNVLHIIVLSVLMSKYDEKTDKCGFGPSVIGVPIVQFYPAQVAELVGRIEKYTKYMSPSLNPYEYAFREYISILKKNGKKINSKGFLAFGKWIKYNYGSNEDAKKLYASLQGYETGWDIAESEDKAIYQLCSKINGNNNIYVFYALDDDGKYKIPKIFIKIKEGLYITDIMGVDDSKGFDDEMNDVYNDAAEDLLAQIIHSEERIEDALIEFRDSRMIPYLIRKANRNEELTKEDYLFLHEAYARNFVFICNDKRITKLFEENPIKNRDIAIEIVSKEGFMLQYVSQELQDDFEVVKIAVSKNGNELRYASPRLREDVYLQQIANGKNPIEQEIPFQGKTK